MPRSKKSEIPEVQATENEVLVTEIVEQGESVAKEAPEEAVKSGILSPPDEAATVNKAASRKKKVTPELTEEPTENLEKNEAAETDSSAKEEPLPVLEPPLLTEEAEARRVDTQRILTIASHDNIETPEEQEATAWHEIRNAYRARRILTGMLGGLERSDSGTPIAIVYYNDYRVVIPYSEMMIELRNQETADNEHVNMDADETERLSIIRMNKLLNNMLGAEVDFIVKGIENQSRSIVASRKDAMMRKRKTFYFDLDSSDMYRIYEGRIVQARVIAVAEKGIRVEAFGVECPIFARDLSYDWVGDAHERYAVGDEVLVRINKINRESLEDLSIQADIRSVTGETTRDNLQKCRVQGKYAGTVTDVRAGVVYIRLAIGVNAIAHTCLDRRTPAKKDRVAFAATRLDEERNVAIGTITRILRQQI